MSPRGEQHVRLFFLYCLSACLSACAADLCNWRGSGLLRDPQSRVVQQVRLRCTEGAVEWMYPSQALRVVLEPNLSSARHSTVCIKPFGGFGGASAYIERAGQLHLLVTEGGRPEQVYCFRADGPQKPAIFLQATLQRDIGRRTVGFRYELLSNGSTAPGFPPTMVQAECRPCNDTELLLAVCSSDFVVRGSISDVSHDSRRQMSLVEVSVERVFRQRSSVFERQTGGEGPWRGRMLTLRRCRVKAGGGHFLFTGAEHFGEAWLGCAPRYTDFVSVYRAALRTGQNHCEFALD
ncbi:meteorin-like protein [Paramormyrops kingsleyae]|uniref:meteorin-like protein n=1 Tax=Paramormyrops kingsleyae TaxID=1676925 RepID=UPI000CD63C64|nr:meteorin-like protein [Paramormyrops kingsleyae]